MSTQICGSILQIYRFVSLMSQDIYSLCFPNDPRGIKLLGKLLVVRHIELDGPHSLNLVYGLFAMEITQTCMLSSDSFHWLVDGWGRFDLLENYYMSWFDVPIMVSVISCTVHSFFAWRIYILSKSFVLPAVILAVSKRGLLSLLFFSEVFLFFLVLAFSYTSYCWYCFRDTGKLRCEDHN